MADFTEVFDDVGENIENTVKKFSKNKTFWLIAGGVAIIALLVFLRNRNSGAGEYAVATGYAGYPMTSGASEDVGGGGGFSDDEVFSILDEMQSSFDSTINEMQSSHNATINEITSAYDATIDELSANVYTLSDRLVTTEQYANNALAEAERQRVINEMQSNSNLYNSITDPNERAYLHAQNQELGASIGLTFDSHTGQWLDESGVQAYTVAVAPVEKSSSVSGKTASAPTTSFTNNIDYQNLINNAILNGADASTINSLNAQRDAKISATGTSLSDANSYYDKNVDYTKLINEAKASGASQAVIDNLTAQRQAKIDGEYGGVDPDTQKKTTTTSSSSSSSSSSKKSSSSSGSYYKSSATSSKTNSNGSTTYTYSNGGSMTVASNGNVTWVTGKKK